MFGEGLDINYVLSLSISIHVQCVSSSCMLSTSDFLKLFQSQKKKKKKKKKILWYAVTVRLQLVYSHNENSLISNTCSVSEIYISDHLY